VESALQQTDLSLLRTIIDSSPDWIFIKDLQHRFVMANALFARTLGRGVEDLIGKTDLDFGVPEELVKGNPDKGIRGFWADDDEVVQTGRTKIIAQESILIDGREHILSTTKIPLENDRHEVWGILVFVHDITLYKQTESALRESEQRYRKLFAEAERKSKELMLLDKLQSALVNKLELDVLFKTIVTSIFDIFRYERILITFLADQRMLTGPYHGYASLPESFSVDDGITGLAA
jgi:PAS domain S-box-containing protein